MNYTYKLTNGNMILRVDDGIWIPKSESNRHYQEYLLWLEEGNTPLPADPLPEPEPFTPEQKLAQAGLTVEELKSLLGL